MLLLCFINIFYKCFLIYLMISLYLFTVNHRIADSIYAYLLYLFMFYAFSKQLFLQNTLYISFQATVIRFYTSLFSLIFSLSQISFSLFYMSFTFIYDYLYNSLFFFTLFSCIFLFSLFTFVNIFVIIITKSRSFTGDVLWGLQLQN